MWPHPPRGTCIPGCGLWGRCHCGCGRPTALAVQSRLNGRGTAVKGRPLVWVHGHAARSRRTGGGAPWGRRGVPAERLRPLAEFLVGLYGTQRAVAEIAGMSEASLSLLRRGRTRRMSPALARRIVDLVLASRRPRDLVATFELEIPPRLATRPEGRGLSALMAGTDDEPVASTRRTG